MDNEVKKTTPRVEIDITSINAITSVTYVKDVSKEKQKEYEALIVELYNGEKKYIFPTRSAMKSIKDSYNASIADVK